MDNPQVVIEHIASEGALRESATAEDLHFVEQFSSESRRREVLAWRGVVRRVLGAECRIFHDDYGAPKVDNPRKYISVSHSKECVAVLFADVPCAIDIEDIGRNFRRVADRYLSEREQALAEQYDIYAELWSAKESLYKYYSKGNLDISNHIVIESYRPTEQILVATILDSAPIEVRLSHEGSLVIAIIC